MATDFRDEKFDGEVAKKRAEQLSGASQFTGPVIAADAAKRGVGAVRSALAAPPPAPAFTPLASATPNALQTSQSALSAQRAAATPATGYRALGRAVAPLAAAGEAVNAAGYTLNTDTQDFYKRFGVDPKATPSNSTLAAIGSAFPEGSRPNAAFQNFGQFARDVGVRTAGAGSDLAAAAVDVGKGAVDLVGQGYNMLPFASDFTGEYKSSDWTARDMFGDKPLTYRDYRGPNSGLSQMASAAAADAVTPTKAEAPPEAKGNAPADPATTSPTASPSGSGPALNSASVGGANYKYSPETGGFSRDDGRPMGGGFMVMDAGAMSQLSPAERESLGQLPRAAAQGSSGGQVYGFGQTGRSFQDIASPAARFQTPEFMARQAQQSQEEVARIQSGANGLRSALAAQPNIAQMAAAQKTQYELQRKQRIDELVNIAQTKAGTPEGAAAERMLSALQNNGKPQKQEPVTLNSDQVAFLPNGQVLNPRMATPLRIVRDGVAYNLYSDGREFPAPQEDQPVPEKPGWIGRMVSGDTPGGN